MTLQNAAFIGLLTLVTLAFIGLLADFAQPIFWAATLAVLFHPAYRGCLQLVKNRDRLAALLTLLLICITVLIPAWFVASAVVNEATTFYTRVQSGEIDLGAALDWLRGVLPFIDDVLDRLGLTRQDLQQRLSSAAVQGSQFVGSLAISAGQNAVRFGVMFFLMLYVLYFFLCDGEGLLDHIVHALPIGDE